MKFIKVRFTEWRDGAQPPDDEVAAAQGKLTELNARDAVVRADLAHTETLLESVSSEVLRDRLAGHAVEADNIYVARKAALSALEAAGNAAHAAMKTHARVGTFGYQVIDEAQMKVVSLLDAGGNALPAGAVYGCEVADANPPAPSWAEFVKG